MGLLGNLFGGLFASETRKTKSEMTQEINNTVNSTCRATSCVNKSSGAIKIDVVMPGCQFTSMQTCKADSSCIIKSALAATAKLIKDSKFTGELGSGKAVVTITKTDDQSTIQQKLDNAINNTCQGSSVLNESTRPIDIGICNGKIDLSQYGDAKTKCQMDALLTSTAELEKKDAIDNTDYTMIALYIFLAVAGVIGIIGFMLYIKNKRTAAAAALEE